MNCPETPWAVECNTHGLVFLTEEEYNYQMNRPNSTWYCPISPGLCNAYWSDDNYEKHMGDQDGDEE